MHKLLKDSPGEEMLLLGNEAIARGGLEAGVAFVTCYPGTPSSEIPLQFLGISKETDLYFEYSVNEKVALEVAAGAAVAGIRSMTTMKHVGLNVAADPLMTLAYTGVNAGLVVVTADDPSLFSSQNEQDNRYYARLSGLPMFEPTNTREMKEMTIAAFNLSEELGLPVLLRTTTRLNHVRGPVALGELPVRKTKVTFQKDPFRFVTVPAVSRRLHGVLLEKQDQARDKSGKSSYNQIDGSGPWGIITNGVSYNYVMDAVDDLGISGKASVYKMGFSFPLPRDQILEFMEGKEKILIVEELEPLMETEIRSFAQDNGITIPIKGKGIGSFSRLYEYNPRMVRSAIAEYFGIDYKDSETLDLSDIPELPQRPPNLCAGCPHRATYYAVRHVFGPDAIHPTDIGCYTLGVLKPLSMGDFSICMGSSVSSSCGFARSTDQKIVAFIGDSTFFHSGITGLIDGVHNNHKFTLVILDNRTTAMTGHQPHPGVDTAPLGLERTMISIGEIVRACGVKDVHIIKPLQVSKAIEAFRAAKEYEGISVIISQEICPLFARAIGQKKKSRPFYINRDKCRNHRICLDKLACPAMFLEGDNVSIDKDMCIGCAVCAQICPENAILPLKE